MSATDNYGKGQQRTRCAISMIRTLNGCETYPAILDMQASEPTRTSPGPGSEQTPASTSRPDISARSAPGSPSCRVALGTEGRGSG